MTPATIPHPSDAGVLPVPNDLHVTTEQAVAIAKEANVSTFLVTPAIELVASSATLRRLAIEYERELRRTHCGMCRLPKAACRCAEQFRVAAPDVSGEPE